MSNFLTTLLSELNLVATYEQASSPELLYIFIENSEGKELSRFQVERSGLIKNSFTEEQKEKLKTLFYNDIWPVRGSIVKFDELIDFIDSNYPPETPLEKQERVLDFFRSLCPHDGYRVEYNQLEAESVNSWRKVYVENQAEFLFYLDSLIEAGYLNVQDRYPGIYTGITLTVAGLNKLVSLDEKKRSKTCFVAMSFDPDLRVVYDHAIVPALVSSGFEPLRIDDNTVTSETTINDAMIAAIKKSRFTIADFTRHKKGVYFEAGYALGRGQKVIYTCHEDEINDAHFDTRNYPHIVWKEAEDLKKKLIDRIEVFIKA